MRRPRVWLLGVGMLSLAACVQRDPNTGQSSSALGSQGQAKTPPKVLAPPAIRSVRFQPPGQGKPILPKFKAQWERNVDRFLAQAKASGKLIADSYDSYRNNNYDKFAITKAATAAVRTPAEFEDSQAYLVTWTDNNGTAVDAIYAEMVKSVWGDLPVIMVYENAAHKTFLEGKLTGAGIPAADLTDTQKIIWWKHTMDSIWTRDFGPIGIVSVPSSGTPKLSLVDFRYYHTRVYDDEIPTDLAATWGVNVYRPDLDFEGGNFMNTSDGLCVATKGVLWNNLQLAQSAVEDILKTYLGCKKVVFPAPLAGEGTTHVDMFSKFGSDTKVLVGEYTSTQDASNKAILDADAALLAGTTNGSGTALTVIRIPMPNQGVSSGETVWRTYTNSLALAAGSKKTILIPVYSDETSNEAAALAAYANAFSGWTQVKIDSKTIIAWGGSIHCITMQIPAGDRTGKMEADPADLCGPKQLACVVGSCGALTAEGCCDGTLVKWCEGGKPMALDCTGAPQCGWNGTQGYYDCGSSTGAVDPSGKFPKSCNVVTDAKVPDKGPVVSGCGNLTEQGCCDGETLYYCDEGDIATLDCTPGPKCGWNSTDEYYDCSTSGTADPTSTYPMSCAGVFGDGGPPKPDQGVVVACGNITEEGCCDGELLKWCESGSLETLDCSNGGPKCGWSAADSYYDCSTNGTADPSGQHPMACSGSSTKDAGPTKDKAVSKADQGATTGDQQVSKPDLFPGDGLVLDDNGSAVDQSTTKADAGAVKKDDGGCDCNVAGAQSGTALPLLLVGLAALIPRRRRR